MIERMLHFFADPWAVVESWRTRREQIAVHSKPTYDAYPGEYVEPPIKLYVEARDARGRLLREYVSLEGYGISQLNWKKGAMRGEMQVRDWFIGQVLEALVRLGARLDEVKEQRDEQAAWEASHREAGQGLAEYALLLALIAIVSIVALLFLGAQISTILQTIADYLSTNP